VAVGLRGPVEEGTYQIERRTVEVSYPAQVQFPWGSAELPKSLSTVCKVSWEDVSGETSRRLRSSTYEVHLPIYDVLTTISELFLAFKLARVGHRDGRGLRAVGIGDTLFFSSSIDGVAAGPMNIGLKGYGGNSAWSPSSAPWDTSEATRSALPHVGTSTVPLSRRFVRAFELIEHGFYAEAFLVAFSLLDDFVQRTLDDLLAARDIAKGDRDELLRGIKEQRLRLFLGPVLRIAFGKDLESMWPQSKKAIEWLNSKRNKIAHSATPIDYASARLGVFACLKAIVVLYEHGATSETVTVEIFREAKITAAWTENPPDWVPRGEAAESMDFRS
jgi:hypothetical protein